MIGSKLKKNALIYFVGNAFYSGLPILLLPYLSSELDLAAYGNLGLYQVFLLIGIPVLSFNVKSSVQVFYYKYEDFPTYFSNVFSVNYLTIAVLVLVSVSLLFNFEWGAILLLFGLHCFFSSYLEIILELKKAQTKAFIFSSYRLLSIFLDVLILVVLFELFNYQSWQIRVVAQVLAMFLVFVTVNFLERKEVGYFNFFRISKSHAKTLLAYSVPLTLHIMSAHLINFSDRFLIDIYLEVESVGIYTASYQLSMVVFLIMTAFNNSYVPWVYKNIRETKLKANSFYKVCFYIFALIIIISIIYYIFLLKFSSYILSPSYLVSLNFVPWLILSFIFKIPYLVFSPILFFKKKVAELTKISLLAAGANILLNLIFLSQVGLYAAVISTGVSFFVMSILVYIVGVKELAKDIGDEASG